MQMENAQVNRLVADQAPDIEMVKEVHRGDSRARLTAGLQVHPTFLKKALTF